MNFDGLCDFPFGPSRSFQQGGDTANKEKPHKFAWLIFAAGTFVGFLLAVLVNIASKLALFAAALIGTGMLIG